MGILKGNISLLPRGCGVERNRKLEEIQTGPASNPLIRLLQNMSGSCPPSSCNTIISENFQVLAMTASCLESHMNIDPQQTPLLQSWSGIGFGHSEHKTKARRSVSTCVPSKKWGAGEVLAHHTTSRLFWIARSRYFSRLRCFRSAARRLYCLQELTRPNPSSLQLV